MTNIYDNVGISGGFSVSANSTTDALYINQLGLGNAVLIEDSTNPDATPFIINSTGNVNIGRIEYLSTSGGTQPKLQVNNSTSQIPSSGLPFTTNFIVQGFNNNSVGFFTTDNNTSQLYFGTPSSVYGSNLSWNYSGSVLNLSTQTNGGFITFGTNQGVERVRIQSDGNVGIGTTTPNANLTVNGSVSATTISGGTFYGDGSNLTGISTQDIFVTGGTYTNGDVTFTNNTGGTFNVSGFSNPSYKVYSALISQTSNNNPTVTILENTLGYTPILTRNLAGIYEIGITSTTINFLYFLNNNSTNENVKIRMGTSFNMGVWSFAITTSNSGVNTDGLLIQTPIEIRIYN